MTTDHTARERADKIVRKLREMLPPKVDYAELVCSPVPSSYGICHVWQDPESYIISDAADLIQSMAVELDEKDRVHRVSVNAGADAIKQLRAELDESRIDEVSTIPCCLCGGEVVEFTVPNDIWNLVMRPDGKETDKEYVCLDCWYKALRKHLDVSRRRERAAVRDFEIASEDGFCSVCAFIGQCTDTESCCFRWRGSPAQPSSDESGTEKGSAGTCEYCEPQKDRLAWSDLDTDTADGYGEFAIDPDLCKIRFHYVSDNEDGNFYKAITECPFCGRALNPGGKE
jgi:hypothetical protein